jgi:NAD(P)-dependent dehydrogenase (short-subunit alcohol dehydrogenase family)
MIMVRLARRQVLQVLAGGAALSALPGCGDGGTVATVDTRLPAGPGCAGSTADQIVADLDLSGQVALVTGCTSGLGFETMRVLASRGAHVIGTGRTLEKARRACELVDGITTPVALELADFQSVVACANEVRAMDLALDMLILNAGINTFGELELVGGIEKIFVVNFLGHFVLVHHLLPGMLAAERGRIVHVSSRAAYRQAPPEGIDFDNLRGEGKFDAGEAYGRSKLANALFSLELARRLADSGVTSNAIHPGLVQTRIARTAPEPVRIAFKWFGGLIAKTPAEGAATQVYAATSPRLAGLSGAYLVDCNPMVLSGSQHLFDAPMAARLWAVAEEMTADYLQAPPTQSEAPSVPAAEQERHPV